MKTKQGRKLIDLTEYKSNITDLDRLQKDLRNSLRPIIFNCDSIEEIYFEALKRIKPINRKVKNNTKSIKSCIEEVLNYLGMYKYKVKVTRLTNDGEIELPEKEINVYNDFQLWVLGYDKVPKFQLYDLKPTVEYHLKKVNNLIKHYEALPEVRHLIENRTFSHNHSVKTILDFYARALKERQLILDYYLEGVYNRALDKSRAKMFNLGLLDFDFWNDYPYETGRGMLGNSIDYRNIDCVSHRISEFSIDESSKYEQLYKNNKASFYKKLFKYKSSEEYFTRIFFNLDHLPLKHDRNDIFVELRKLFNQRKWLSFYALALPQVEGLFSEMILSANPKSAAITKALSDKVRTVRPDYMLSDSYFDYYEYELPNQRNSFMHTGKTDDYQMKAFDLLTDLDHIVSVFASLGNPYVNLTRIIKKRDQIHFSNYTAFADFFELIDNLHSDQKNDNQNQLLIGEFIENFLNTECSLEYIIYQSCNTLTELVNEQWGELCDQLSKFEFPTEPNKINESKLKMLLQNEDFFKTANNIFLYGSTRFEDIFKINSFFLGIKKHVYKKEIPEVVSMDFRKYETIKKKVKPMLDLQHLIKKKSKEA